MCSTSYEGWGTKRSESWWHRLGADIIIQACDKDKKQEGTVSVLSGQLRTKGTGKNRERSSKTPQGRKQINSECGTIYRTTDLLSARSQCHQSKERHALD